MRLRTAQSLIQNTWGGVTKAAPDQIFGINQLFLSDKHPSKVSLIIGAYRDENGKPYVFPIVRKVEGELIQESLNKEYLQMEGDSVFTEYAKRLVFGNECKAFEHIVTCQTLSGTGALRMGAEFLSYALPKKPKVYISDPTWPNHLAIFKKADFADQTFYPYYDSITKSLNFKGMMDSLKKAEPGSVILLHGCAHNPTGIDPTQEQWKYIAEICKEKNLVPFIDLAYQGFATGDLEKDAFAPRYFADQGLQILVAQSFAKNAGLYGERIGALHVVCSDKNTATNVLSNIQTDIRAMYSNPPSHGARIISRILKKPEYFSEWRLELQEVSKRIQNARTLLHNELLALKTPGKWDHIVNQIGMFSYTGLTPTQCQFLIDKHHVYLMKTGRVSIAGINPKNVKYLANAIHDAVLNAPKI